VEEIFIGEPSLINLSSPVVAVGDLHGHLPDLLRILQRCGLPDDNPNLKYLFLGDLVDRGEFSLETITLIYLLKVVYPFQIYVIRGNHEFESVCSANGFQRELTTVYPNSPELFKAFISSFASIPFGAVIDNLTVCVHGGIGPTIESVSSIQAIVRPAPTFASPEIGALVWSDPSDSVVDFEDSPRGCGFLFGEGVLLAFLERSKATRLLRAHQFVPDGCLTLFEDRLVTVFSASNYCGTNGNTAGVLILSPDGRDSLQLFEPLAYPRRSSVVVRRPGAQAKKITGSLSDSLPRRAKDRSFFTSVPRKMKDGRPPLPPGVHPAGSHEPIRLAISRHRSQPVFLLRDVQWDVIHGGK
jgi:protein phosphatase